MDDKLQDDKLIIHHQSSDSVVPHQTFDIVSKLIK